MALTIAEGSRAHRLTQAALGAVALVLLLVLPYMMGDRAGIASLTQVAAYSVAVLGLSLLIGHTGQISVGQGAFVGLGGYASMILVAKEGWPYLATVPTAFVLCGIAGALIGIPALRIRGLYLVTVTLAVAAVFPVLVDKWPSLTGGTNGLFAVNPMKVPGWLWVDPYTTTGPDILRYYAVVVVALIMFLLAYNILHSRVGRAMRAVRDAPLAAAATGVPVASVKVFAFAISAAFAGVSGALLVIQTPAVSDVRFNLNLSIFLLVAMIVGGSRSILGVIPGAVIFVVLRTYIADWASGQSWLDGPKGQQVPGIVSGVLLLAFIFLLPGGVADGIKRLVRKVVVVVPRVPDGWEKYRLVSGPSDSEPAEMVKHQPVPSA
jgi:branched-chain amino acid transport system permease protein